MKHRKYSIWYFQNKYNFLLYLTKMSKIPISRAMAAITNATAFGDLFEFRRQIDSNISPSVGVQSKTPAAK